MGIHIPVMLDKVLSVLQIKKSGIYVDLTLGRGGHSLAILKKLESGMLVAFDKDQSSLIESEEVLAKTEQNFKLIHSDYKNIKYELGKLGINSVDGILADLGVSSPQIDSAHRGFSYNKDARLDMRMDQRQKLDAHLIVNQWSVEQLVIIFRNHADVKLPQRVAKGIFLNRPIDSTLQLVDVIRKSLPAAIVRKKNPAKAVFQALRMAVNGELESLEQMLEQSTHLLKVGASIAVITFHSIEDRVVKRFFRKFMGHNTGNLPVIAQKKWQVKTYKPSANEIESNSRARSANLRVLSKLED